MRIDFREVAQTGRYAPVCKDIVACIHGLPTDPVDLGSARIERAEQLLMRGEWESALGAMSVVGLRGADADRAKLLRIAAQLHGTRPLARLLASQVDACVTTLKALCATQEAPAALYLLGVLSRYYFQANGLHDSSGGIRELKAKARATGRLSARTMNVIRPALPDGRAFELEWKRTI